MTLKLSHDSIEALEADLEVILIFNKAVAQTQDAILLEAIGYEAGHAKTQLLLESRRLYVGVEKNDTNSMQIVGASIAKALGGYHYRFLKAHTQGLTPATFKALCEGVLLGNYQWLTYKSKPKPSLLTTLTFSLTQEEFQAFNEACNQAQIIAQSVNYVRDIVNTIPEAFYPKTFSQLATNLAKAPNFSCDILEEDSFLDEGMQAMYMVGRASVHKSQLIHLSYKPQNPKAVITLVGKGLTYDSGGLSLKPAESMVTMKMDKSGAATVLGILKAAGDLKLPIEIHGFLGAVENMIGGNAYKPDDVLVAKNGTTIEVRNTDAEGRLVLADVLCYAQEKVKSDYLFDYATLTGACVVALGPYTTGVMGHSHELKHSFYQANATSGEFIAGLPFNDHLKEELKSEIADIKNVAGKWGGAITAGLFLDHFIDEDHKQKWLHFDIAGPAYTEKPWGVNPYGATGAGVRTTIAWMQALLQSK